MAPRIVLTDGGGERWEVCDYTATFTVRSLDRPNSWTTVSSHQMGDFGIEWDGRKLKDVGNAPRHESVR